MDRHSPMRGKIVREKFDYLVTRRAAAGPSKCLKTNEILVGGANVNFRKYELFSTGSDKPVGVFVTATGVLYVRTLWDFVDPDDAAGSFEEILNPLNWSSIRCIDDGGPPNFIAGPGHG